MPRTAALCAAVLAICVVYVTAESTPVVQTTYGPVQGTVESGVNVFHSIPFAAPPLAENRFARPVPPQKWTDTKDVSGLPNICPQLHITGDLFLGNEDCLYLHVYAPETTSDVKLPVMFWIFGGGYMLGDAYEFGWYDGVKMATDNNVIVVAANYRVGALGFLATPELQAADPKHSTGNQALLDQTFALQWTRDNIANFGGDPEKVAIFGESAGGFSVCWHLVSPESAGLFSAAIMESGSCGTRAFFYGIPEAFQYAKNVSANFGCVGTGEPYLECLRTVSIDKIMNADLGVDVVQTWHDTKGMLGKAGVSEELLGLLPPTIAPVMPFGPTIDGVSLLAVPLDTLRAGNFNKVPTIFGSNLNEGRIFVPLMVAVIPGSHFPPTNQDIFNSMVHFFQHYSTNATAISEAATSVLAEYTSADFDGNEWYRAAKIMTNFIFTCDARKSALAISGHGVPMWVYQFTYKLDWIEYGLLGDYHTSELDFVWGNQWPPILHAWTHKSDFQLSSAMQNYWTNMAANGSPNDATAPLQWPAFNETLHTIDLKWPLAEVEDLDGARCDFWDNLLANLEKQ